MTNYTKILYSKSALYKLYLKITFSVLNYWRTKCTIWDL